MLQRQLQTVPEGADAGHEGMQRLRGPFVTIMTPLPCLTGDGAGDVRVHPTSAATPLQVGAVTPSPALPCSPLASPFECKPCRCHLSAPHSLFTPMLQADMGRVPVLGSRAEYERMYERSLAEPAQFWADMAKKLGLYFKQQVARQHVKQSHLNFTHWVIRIACKHERACISRTCCLRVCRPVRVDLAGRGAHGAWSRSNHITCASCGVAAVRSC